MSNTSIVGPRRSAARLYLTLTLTILAIGAWLRGEHVDDDRGSDSSEKSLMIILAISIGGLVTAAATAYIATKTALFE